jgi:hypothetical protein
LSRDDVEYIDRRAGAVYEQLVERADREFGRKWGGRKDPP